MIKNGLGRCSSFLTVLLLTMALTGCSRQTDDTKQHFSNTSDGLITADTDIVTEENTETPLTVIEYISMDLKQDELQFHNPLHRKILAEAEAHLHQQAPEVWKILCRADAVRLL